jgi:4'-phosphopantetheinyl transferase
VKSPQLTWLSVGLEEVPAADEWMDTALARRLDAVRYTKRYNEARLARWTAKVAIALTFGLPTDLKTLATVVVRNAPDGAPEAYLAGEPIDAVIAMTDRADWAVCAVLRDGGRVGCDLELVEPRSPAFVNDYLTVAERDAVAASADPDFAANTIWSAKESALKVLRTGLRRDTRSVEVTLNGHAEGAWRTLSIADVDGRTFPGWWNRFGEFVFTCATEQPTDKPTSLEIPPAIATASPAHTWMSNPLRP